MLELLQTETFSKWRLRLKDVRIRGGDKSTQTKDIATARAFLQWV